MAGLPGDGLFAEPIARRLTVRGKGGRRFRHLGAYTSTAVFRAIGGILDGRTILRVVVRRAVAGGAVLGTSAGNVIGRSVTGIFLRRTLNGFKGWRPL
jgi:hypothetical protein